MLIVHEETIPERIGGYNEDSHGLPPGKILLDTYPVFEVRSLIYHYPDGHAALNGIDLTILEGDRIALVGQNGAGKTTLIKHLNGLYCPARGTVHFRGAPLTTPRLATARLQIGMLFQDPDDQLFCNTLNEDLTFGPKNQGLGRQEVENRVQTSLQRMGLEHLRYKAPHHLSYGQKKRAAFATLLAMNPDVLILDEPTANLDPKQERFFIELLQQFQGTLICISHDLPFLYGLCSRAVVLENGKIHHDFSMEDLVSRRTYLRDHGLDFTFRPSCCHQGGLDHFHPHSDTGEVSRPLPSPRTDQETDGDSSLQPLIRLQDYSYRYPDGTWGFREVGLSIQEGESVAIVGENGAGKSTLVSCLAGILQGNGEYVFAGNPVLGKYRRELWIHFGTAFQDPADQLFCPNCWDEVAFGPKQLRLPSGEVRARVEESLALVRLTGYEKRVPHHMSAGERKRLALAAVLSMHPRVLILDEPTANLDPRSEELLCTILQKLAVTKILISHDIDIISMLCQRTLVMHEGRLIRDYATVDFLHDEHLVSINGLDYTFKNACCKEIRELQEAGDRTSG